MQFKSFIKSVEAGPAEDSTNIRTSKIEQLYPDFKYALKSSELGADFLFFFLCFNLLLLF
jgi:hypothetical protein